MEFNDTISAYQWLSINTISLIKSVKVSGDTWLLYADYQYIIYRDADLNLIKEISTDLYVFEITYENETRLKCNDHHGYLDLKKLEIVIVERLFF